MRYSNGEMVENSVNVLTISTLTHSRGLMGSSKDIIINFDFSKLGPVFA